MASNRKQEYSLKIGETCGGQIKWVVITPRAGLTDSQRDKLHAQGWKFGRYKQGRGWSKSGAAFLAGCEATDEQAREWLDLLREEAAYCEA